MQNIKWLLAVALTGLFIAPVQAQTNNAAAETAELVKKFLNPVADLISVPLQNNWDWGLRAFITFLFPKL